MTAALIAAALSPVFALPAEACSCAAPGDIREWVDTSEAVFVGNLVDRQEAGSSEMFGEESIYVFEVEEWVKGDLGDVIEVRSASDGAACGFEFWDPDMRTGAAIYLEDGELRGGLCSQIDADVLLAAMEEPTLSTTGVGHLLVSNGWESTRLTVLDREGHHVITLTPDDSPEWTGTQHLRLCPEEELAIQVTQERVYVWNLVSFELVATHDTSQVLDSGWPADASCRTADASSIWLLVEGENSSHLIEVIPEISKIMDLPGTTGRIGSDYLVSQDGPEGDVTWVDVETGRQATLTETPAGQLVGTSVATHATEPIVAVLRVIYSETEPTVSELTIFQLDDEASQTFEMTGEAYSPVWLDARRISAYAHNTSDWEQTTGVIIDIENGEMTQLDGWKAQHTLAEGEMLYGVDGGSILQADPASGRISTLVTLPTQFAGPMVALEDAPSVDIGSTTTTEPGVNTTTPPLVAPELESGDGSGDVSIQWIAGGAMVAFLGVLAWLAMRKPRQAD